MLPEAAACQETGFAEENAEGFSLNIVWYVGARGGCLDTSARTVLRAVERYGHDLVGGTRPTSCDPLHAPPPPQEGAFTIFYDFLGLNAITRNPVERVMVHGMNSKGAGMDNLVRNYP